jgi:hypothetical protein
LGADDERMMNTKKLLGATAFTVALAGGGVAGAILGVPGTSGAQEPTTTTATADAPDGHGPGFGFRARHEVRMDGLEAAADALGMTVDDLRAELQDGKTIAAVADAKGVDVQTVIDAMVAEATADITEHITDVVNNGFPEPGDRVEKLDAVATALGLTPEELRTELQSGTSLADVATDQGVDVQTVIDALVAAGVPADRAEDIVNHAGPLFDGHHRGPRP